MHRYSEQRIPSKAAGQGTAAAILAAVLLVLAGCDSLPLDSLSFGASEPSDPAKTDTSGAGNGDALETISASILESNGPEVPGEIAQPTAPGPETVAALPVAPAIDDDPQQLIGMGPASLSAFLGAPELIRCEAPASLWQYRAEGCVLDVVLYPERGGDKVTYLEARDAGVTRMPPRQCLNKLLRSRFDDSAG